MPMLHGWFQGRLETGQLFWYHLKGQTCTFKRPVT